MFTLDTVGFSGKREVSSEQGGKWVLKGGCAVKGMLLDQERGLPEPASALETVGQTSSVWQSASTPFPHFGIGGQACCMYQDLI